MKGVDVLFASKKRDLVLCPDTMCLGESIEPASSSLMARGPSSQDAIAGDGKCATLKAQASLEQVAFISHCMSSPFVLPLFLCIPNLAAEVEDHEELPA